MTNQNGFTLIELLIVISLIALATVMANQAWQKLYTRSNFDYQTQNIISALTKCSEQSQTSQRRILLKQCNLTIPDGITLNFEFEPAFSPDGTSNGAAIVVKGKQQQVTLVVDQLTSSIKVNND